MASELENLNPSARIMTFHPTMEEFKNFSRYIAYIESQGAHRAGLAKVVPPKEWKPRRWYDDIDDVIIPAPIQQVVTGQSGLFTQYNIQKKAMTVREFRRIANSDKYCTPRYTDFEDLERKYWKNLTFNAPIYGADVNGTLYDKHVDDWNIGHLNTILDVVENESGITIEGVNTPYLYFGMWKTSFAWHTEDMDLYSINYLHFGEPKSWYCVPPEHGKRLERLAKGFFPGSAQNCEAFLRHKMTLISPSILKKYGIPFDKVTQEAGEFMITFPYGYHAGFNHGFNCAESTNFATLRWIEYGKQSVLCSCRKDMVKISMDVFVRKYQPDRYKLWKAGKDVTVIDHALPTPEAAEFFKGELLQKVKNEKHCPDDTELEEECSADGDIEKKSMPKHRIGTKRHRVCLEVPHEVSQSEAFPKEELGPVQFEMDVAESPVGPAREPVQQGEQGIALPEYGDSSEVKFEELKNVKLDDEEEEPEAAVLDLSISHSVTSTGIKLQSSVSSLQSDSPMGSGSSDSEPSDLYRQDLEQPEVLMVHSYAKEEVNDMSSERPSGKKASATTRVNEQDLAKMAKEYIRSVKDHKKSKGRRQPLSKLPRHHPLLVKDGLSDDEMSEQLNPEEEAEETEAWAKPLGQLWQNRPPNFEAEKEYNAAMAQQAPYCAVCMLFQTYQADCGGQSSQVVLDAGGKMRTKPLIPEMCFTTTGCSTDVSLSTPYLEEDGTSLLVTCKRCRVRVHASCYGVAPEKATGDWKCSRCRANALEEDCCLCSLRGGALQRANGNKWVHVMCAVAVLEAKFVNIAERSPVDVSKIPLQRFRLKCVFCKKRRKRTAGCCMQCSHGRCPTSFHVSCAQAAGVMMQPDDWPFVVFTTCFRHKIPSQAERALQDLVVGQAVISKHKNGRFYQCEVINLTKETFYEVNFDDGSFSDNLYPEDIVSRDCAQLGPPAAGEVVQVRWTDGQIYGATFVASHVIQMYQVEFEDGSQLMAKRDDVYTLNEELPKRVKSRLSVASDMRFTEIFTEKEVKQERKRQRVINSRYREDYIEPALYRAIME
uniref:Lysine-specific demethylase 4A n=1 Tax=Anolis carolinensis TaxID=28377 RepID=G1KPP0_ANOCA|nr:PREDICTED: lysine-specific demethylase 4A [Anolis carolinensis]XP_008107693.1 PREDICTED: lysine-specific demethylase 4A [Anolis carolinensis]XP_008107694.1 PREDICTED: lysine-specific demethylase 4A [Anolis carolinensis]XP_008107695.1 PREDICTED: lysine-specific demethylase 4A [Anolis carolinensis]XP_016848707.1 PREDICTED: lysine-specific demethylase 4A [Anolis carolinensis]|eukprot:XP_008107692.1 PREDICTED: lysine-specific demethylase 4A [Anolis carolinensis]